MTRLNNIPTFPLCVFSMVVSLCLLGGGSLWARAVVSAFQQREGVLLLSGLSPQSRYEFWGVSFPAMITMNLIVVAASFSLFVLWRRRDFFSIGILSVYFIVLAGGGLFFFAGLGISVFGWFD